MPLISFIILKIKLYRRRLIGAIALSLASFFVAHSINAVIAYQITDTFDQPNLYQASLSLTDTAPADLSSPSSEELSQHILQSGLFLVPKHRSLHKAGSEGNEDSDENSDATTPLNLSKTLVLRGTSYGDGDVHLSTAMIEEISSKTMNLYHLRETIPNAGELVEIRREGVRIQQGRQKEFLPIRTGDLEETSPIPGGNFLPDPKKKMQLDRREVNAALSDLSKLLAQARANPYFVNGKVSGFHLTIFNPDSFFGRIGLISGDILKRVNGMEVRDPGQVVGLFQQVKEERQVKVDVLRNDRPTTLTYEIR